MPEGYAHEFTWLRGVGDAGAIDRLVAAHGREGVGDAVAEREVEELGLRLPCALLRWAAERLRVEATPGDASLRDASHSLQSPTVTATHS